jgi:hypothetical protein
VFGIWKRDGLGSSFGFDSCGLVFGVLGVVSFGSGGFPNILGENKEDVVLELEPPKEKAEFWRGCVSFFGSSFLGSSFFVSLLLLLLLLILRLNGRLFGLFVLLSSFLVKLPKIPPPLLVFLIFKLLDCT